MISAILANHQWWEVVIGGVCTLAIFSFLIKENPFFRLFEHLFIGIATAVSVMVSIRSFLWPKVFKPLLGWDRLLLPDGAYSVPYNRLYLLFLLPMAFGSLYYCVLTKRHTWLASLVIGFSFGVAGGNSFEGTFNELRPQIIDSFRSLYPAGGTFFSAEALGQFVFIFVLITSLSYFFFTFKRQPGGLADRASFAGRWVMMGCFGAFFGSTMAARMALLVERMDFLLLQWSCHILPSLSSCNHM